ncbi:MAG: hypothetical protein B6226_00705 [Candidatus Cloacimonetes bacterium 4572_65]|nr:MAG: hypothetical protein B6226_00705 [Candidatus Cloacimonetes bacterium 4572_65]
MKWRETTLENIIYIKHGYAFKGEYFAKEGEVIVVTPGNFNESGGFRIRIGKEKFYTHSYPEEYLLKKNDLVVAMTEQGEGLLGSAGLVPADSIFLHNQRIGLVSVDEKLLYKNFLYYLFNSNYIRQQIRNTSSGSKVRHTSPKRIYGVKFYLPPLLIQKKIAAILTAYDNIIENNDRRISLLERSVQEIYNEWFVRMRFPNYENTKFEKGIPYGWDIVELKKIASESSNSTKTGDHLSDRKYLPLDIISSKKFLPLGHYHYTDAKSSLITFEKGEFIFGAMRPYQHKVVIAPFDGITRTTCFVIKPIEKNYYSFLYLTLFKKTSIDYAMLISNGSDRPYTVWKKGMEKMGVIKPDILTAKKFNKIVEPMLNIISEKYYAQRKLKSTRDKLSSRLISGKLSVDDLDIKFPPSMEE